MTLFFNTGLFYTVLSNTFLVQRRNTNTVNNQAFFISHLRLVSLFFKECWEPGFTGFVKGRFPFSQNFRKFRLGRKWKTFRRFVQMEIPGKSGKSKKVGPFSRLELSERNFVFHLHVSHTLYQFQLLPTRQPS